MSTFFLCHLWGADDVVYYDPTRIAHPAAWLHFSKEGLVAEDICLALVMKE